MNRRTHALALSGALVALAPGISSALTREVAEVQPTRFIFPQSVLSQLTHGTYRDPYDELQSRPYNLLFTNIGRHPNLSPWEGQEGSYKNYLSALFGNNGTANVDNDADAIEGGLVRRETPGLAWGVAAAFLAGSDGNDDTSGTATFSGNDDLSGHDVRGAAAYQISQRGVLGGGFRLTQANTELADHSFEDGVGGFSGVEEFDQSEYGFDIGLRQFIGGNSSWETRLIAQTGSAEQSEFSEDLDADGNVTGRFTIANYEINDQSFGIRGAYNRLTRAALGEMEFGAGIDLTKREIGNDDLAFSQAGDTVTPELTLLGQDPISTTRMFLSARSVFQAGETEMFAGAQLAQETVAGSTEVDAAGTIVNEEIDDSQMQLGLTIGLRQPVLRDRLRFIVSGHADFVNREQSTLFDTGTESDDSSLSTSQYAIGLEGVLANVTFDLAWLLGEEAPVQPVDVGLPTGSRRAVELDLLVFSAAVAW